MKNKHYLSCGFGVNSIAAFFIDNYNEVIFCDTGNEYPETYEFINKFVGKYSVKIIQPKESLYDYSWRYKMVPATWPRWCSVRLKIEPFAKYVDKKNDSHCGTPLTMAPEVLERR